MLVTVLRFLTFVSLTIICWGMYHTRVPNFLCPPIERFLRNEGREECTHLLQVPYPNLVTLDMCMLANYTDLPVPVAASRCSMRCGAMDGCSIFCITASSCLLSAANVSISWQGGYLPETSFDACYTRYPTRGNLLTPDLTINSTTAYTYLGITKHAAYAEIGYQGCSGVMCYTSNDAVVVQFWTTDMKTPKNISKILFHGFGATRIDGKQIRAGLDPDIFSDPVVVTLTYVADFYLHYFELVPPILARYIGITGQNSVALSICKLMAFE